MGMKNCAFAVKLLSKLCNDEQNLGSRNVNNFGQVNSSPTCPLHSVCAPFAPKSHPTLPSQSTRSIPSQQLHQASFKNLLFDCLRLVLSFRVAPSSRSRYLFDNGRWNDRMLSMMRILHLFPWKHICTMVCFCLMLYLNAILLSQWMTGGHRPPLRISAASQLTPFPGPPREIHICYIVVLVSFFLKTPIKSHQT